MHATEAAQPPEASGRQGDVGRRHFPNRTTYAHAYRLSSLCLALTGHHRTQTVEPVVIYKQYALVSLLLPRSLPRKYVFACPLWQNSNPLELCRVIRFCVHHLHCAEHEGQSLYHARRRTAGLLLLVCSSATCRNFVICASTVWLGCA